MVMELDKLYGDATELQRRRYARAAERFRENFGAEPEAFLSAPGRSELGGNHTDHQHGCVLTAAVDLDSIAAVRRQEAARIDVVSEGYEPFSVDLDTLSPLEGEKGHSAAVVRGVAAGLKNRGYRIGGFSAWVTSDVLRGSGLSSSASFEVLIGAILNALYNEYELSATEMAMVGQYAENEFFGKPCGLQDQMACALGGVSYIDFLDTSAPVHESIGFDLRAHGYALCVVDTGGGHDSLTAEYAAIPHEMGEIAQRLGQKWLRFCEEEAFLARLPELRAVCGDRAVLRALHFFSENRRPAAMAGALKRGDMDAFLRTVRESGRSSWEYLQNVSVSGAPDTQPVALGLSLSERLLEGCGAWRVHGGGFAGTIQAYVPLGMLSVYRSAMEAVFGAGCCSALSFRSAGAVLVQAEDVISDNLRND